MRFFNVFFIFFYDGLEGVSCLEDIRCFEFMGMVLVGVGI